MQGKNCAIVPNSSHIIYINIDDIKRRATSIIIGTGIKNESVGVSHLTEKFSRKTIRTVHP